MKAKLLSAIACLAIAGTAAAACQGDTRAARYNGCVQRVVSHYERNYADRVTSDEALQMAHEACRNKGSIGFTND